MSEVPDLADEVFRDYVIADVPSSGEHEPAKSAIRELLRTAGNEIDAVGPTATAAAAEATAAAAAATAAAENAATGYLSFATTSAMNAFTTADDNQTAYNAETDSYYRWNDGGSAWVFVRTAENARIQAAIASIQTTTLRELAARRSLPVLPAFSAIAIKEEPLSSDLTFARAATTNRVNAKGLVESVASGALRHGYDPDTGEYLGIVLAPAATNIWQRSEDATNASITKNSVTVTGDAGVAPDGATTADKVVPAAASASHSIEDVRSGQTVAQLWNLSGWVKAAGYNFARLEIADNSSATNLVRANFALSGEGSVSRAAGLVNGTSVRAFIDRYPGGWYRISLSGIPNTSGTALRARLYVMASDASSASFTGDGTSGLLVWGFQLKAGRVKGGYVPNLASSTTTSTADALSITSPGSWFNADRMTAYYEFYEAEAAGAARTLFTISDGTADDTIVVRINASDKIEAEAVTGGVSQAIVTGPLVVPSVSHRVAVGWDDGILALTCDGEPTVTATMAGTPDVTRIDWATTYQHTFSHFAAFPRLLVAKQMELWSAPDRFVPCEDAIEETVVDGWFVVSAIDPDGVVYPSAGAGDDTSVEEATATSKVLGNLTATGFDFQFDANATAAWEVATDEDFETIVDSGTTTPVLYLGSTQTYVRHAVSVAGLDPATEYFVRLTLDGNVESGHSFNITTLPASGPLAHRIAVSSCANPTASSEEMPAFAAMADDAPLYHFQIGDWGYPNQSVDDIKRFRDAFRIPLLNPQVQVMMATCCMVYVWDDHDGAAGNNWQRLTTFPNPSTSIIDMLDNAFGTYEETYPHYDLVHAGSSSADKVLTQVVPVGLVKHIAVDTRSQRRWVTPSDSTCTVLGNGTSPAGSWNQFLWLKSELLAAGAAGMKLVVLHLPSVPHDSVEGWYTRAPDEYVAFCDYVRDTAGLPAILMTAGDIHHHVADDGGYTDKSTGGGMTVPLLVTSAAHMPIGGAEHIDAKWLGSTVRIIAGGTGGVEGANRQYLIVDFAADGTWEASLKGIVAGVATELASYASDDDVPAVDFHAATTTAVAGGTFSAAVDKSWFGPIGALDGSGGTATVNWATNQGSPQTGTLHIRPNCGKYTITGAMPASGSIVITLSSPSAGIELGPQTTITVNPA